MWLSGRAPALHMWGLEFKSPDYVVPPAVLGATPRKFLSCFLVTSHHSSEAMGSLLEMYHVSCMSPLVTSWIRSQLDSTKWLLMHMTTLRSCSWARLFTPWGKIHAQVHMKFKSHSPMKQRWEMSCELPLVLSEIKVNGSNIQRKISNKM